jgi:hypothetical protein
MARATGFPVNSWPYAALFECVYFTSYWMQSVLFSIDMHAPCRDLALLFIAAEPDEPDSR